MLDGSRRFAVTTNTRGQRELISSPYRTRGPGIVMGSASEYRERQRRATGGSRNFESRAFGDSMASPGGGFSGAQTVVSKNVALGMLEEFLPQDRHIRNRIFRDIYFHDAVAGGAVDIYATLPWSDFYLSGLRDREALDVYHKSVESMRLKILLPAISRDFMVLGVFIGSTVFDSQENIFSAVMPQNIDFCEIVEVPVYGMDPLITLKVPETTRKLFGNAKDPRVQNILQNMPQHLADSFRGGTIPLEPENTLYIPRRSITSDMVGTSYFERILPIHLMEKALFRSSIDQAYRRTRSILHIMVGGDGDDYVPTQQDMESQRDLWLAADMDPTGAIIVTRTGIQPNEVRNASDFWRIDETFDFFSTAKYRALGINEAFLTGDANYNTADAALSVFIEQMRAYRAMLAQEIFYQKIFPAIALANGFTKEQYQTIASKNNRELDAYFNGTEYVTNGGIKSNPYMALCSDTRHGLNIHGSKVQMEDLALPHIIWQKHLRPEGDQTYFELLSNMQDKGIPVPLSMMSMAGGIDINSVLSSMDEDIKLRRQVKRYMDKIAEFNPQAQDDQSQEAQARAIESIASRFSVKRPVGLFSREYDDRLLPHFSNKSGKRSSTSRKGRQIIYNKLNKRLARSMAKIAERENSKVKRTRKENRRLMVHARMGVIK